MEEMAGLVKAAGYRMVAEIETERMLNEATDVGFDYAQGYFFGKPS